jgi:hypothetical protein
MGDDFKSKTERVYRHSLRRKVNTLTQQSMFATEEIKSTSYPCQLVDPERPVKVGTRLTIFQRSPGAKITVLEGTQVIATIEGEPATDLKVIFSKNPECTRLLDVECISADGSAPVIEVCAAHKRRKKGNAK